MRAVRVLGLACALSVIGCPPLPVVPAPDADSSPPPLPAAADASPADGGDDLSAPAPKDAAKPPAPVRLGCDVDCLVFEFLGCPEGALTPKGKTCLDVCSVVDGLPGIDPWPHECIARARSIAELRKCKNRGGSPVKCPTPAK